MNRQDYINLCVKYITENISESEKRKLAEWIDQSDDNIAEYEKLKRIWTTTEPEKTAEVTDIDNEWMKLNNRLELDKSNSKKYSFFDKLADYLQAKLTVAYKPLGAAAIVILLAVVGFNLLDSAGPEHKLIEVTTANSINKTVVLPDGSEVTLNSGSKLTYLDPFKENSREVELEGEAFFSVTKNNVPFVIETNNAKVKVLGTQFNVWSRDEATKVVVKNGKVELSSQEFEKAKVLLTRNKASEVIGNEVPEKPRTVNSEYLLGWLNGKLVFNKTSLAIAADELERHYNIKVKVEDDKLKDLSLTGEFTNDKPDDVVDMICLALNINYEKNDGEFILKSK